MDGQGLWHWALLHTHHATIHTHSARALPHTHTIIALGPCCTHTTHEGTEHTACGPRLPEHQIQHQIARSPDHAMFLWTERGYTRHTPITCAYPLHWCLKSIRKPTPSLRPGPLVCLQQVPYCCVYSIDCLWVPLRVYNMFPTAVSTV